MRRPILACALLLSASAARAQGAPPAPASGLTATAALGTGAEFGLSHGKAGVLELEAAAGWELADLGLRPELALAFGVAPEGDFALRPGLRYTLPGSPVQLRVAVDRSSARQHGLHWRWVLLGAAAELRLTALLGVYGEVDTGVPLSSSAGVPLLLRGGVSFRF